MFRKIGLLLLAFTGLLSGCDQIRSLMPAPDVPPAISLKREELLKAVLFNSPTKDARSMNVSVSDESAKFQGLVQVTAKEVVQIDAEHAILLTENLPLNKSGEPLTGHCCGAWLGGYFFSKTSTNKWSLDKKMSGIASTGVWGSIGETSVTKFGKNNFALVIKNGSCWQGHCLEWISIYGLLQKDIISYLPTTTISSSILGAAREICDRINEAYLSNKNFIDKPALEDIDRDEEQCFDIKGTYLLSKLQDTKNNLIISFKGFDANWKEKGNELSLKIIDSKNIYQLIDNKFKLIKGDDPLKKDNAKF